MTPAEAAWVRKHVWTAPMRKTYREVPGFYTKCDCQAGLTTACQTGRHEQCHRAEPLPSYAAHVCSRGGDVALFPEPYAHRTPSATGPQYEQAALVWLADRICRWVCPCDCGHPEPAPPEPVQLDLFQEVA